MVSGDSIAIFAVISMRSTCCKAIVSMICRLGQPNTYRCHQCHGEALSAEMDPG